MPSTDESVKITLVPREAIEQVWADVEQHLIAALEHAPGRFAVEDVLGELMAGKSSLWLAVDGRTVIAFCVTKIYETPQARVCAFEWIGGKQAELWFDKGMNMIEDFARQAGCQRIEAHGRKGWQPFLERNGFQFLSISFDKEL